MSFLAWIVFGLISGFIASKIVNKSGEGVVMEMPIQQVLWASRALLRFLEITSRLEMGLSKNSWVRFHIRSLT